MGKYTSEQYLALAKLSFTLYVEKYKASSNLQYSLKPKANRERIHAVANQVKINVNSAEFYTDEFFNLFNELNDFDVRNGLPDCKGERRKAGLQAFDEKHFVKHAILNELSYDDELNNRIKDSLKLSNVDRLEALGKSLKLPKCIEVTTRRFVRNANVIVYALNRADGVCERCSEKAPFLRAKDGTPYLEVHHSVKLADGGEDTIENAIALCPTCHRKLHYGLLT